MPSRGNPSSQKNDHESPARWVLMVAMDFDRFFWHRDGALIWKRSSRESGCRVSLTD